MIENAAAYHAAANHYRYRALGKRHIAGYCAEGEAKPVERRIGEAVGPGHGGRPQLLFVMEGQRLLLHSAERLIEVHEARARRNPLHRHAAKVPAEPGENLVLELVERREIDMPALGLDHLIMIVPAQQRRDAEAGPRPDDGNDALIGQRFVGAPDRAELVVRQRCDGMGDRPEIVDDGEAVDAEPLLHQVRPDHPRVVRELQDFAADRPRDGDR